MYFPDELVLLILTHLFPEDIQICTKVCKQWKSIVNIDPKDLYSRCLHRHPHGLFTTSTLNGDSYPESVFWELMDFKDGLRDGLTIKYRKQKRTNICFYKKGALHGTWKSFYHNGNVDTEGTMKFNVQHGLWCKYYPFGSLEQSCTYRYGKKHGFQYRFHVDGRLWSITEFDDGLICDWKLTV